MAEYPVFHIDKDDDAQMRASLFAKDFYERIIEAQNLALMNEINANTVVINGRKYGMLKYKPGFVPTIFGMKAEARADMPGEWDFFLQERPPQPKTNADRVRAMTDEELAAYHSRMIGCPMNELESFEHCTVDDGCMPCQCWLDWLREEAKE